MSILFQPKTPPHSKKPHKTYDFKSIGKELGAIYGCSAFDLCLSEHQSSPFFRFDAKSFSDFTAKHNVATDQLYFPLIYCGVVAFALKSSGYSIFGSDISHAWSQRVQNRFGIECEVRPFDQLPSRPFDLAMSFEPIPIYCNFSGYIGLLNLLSHDRPFLVISGLDRDPRVYLTSAASSIFGLAKLHEAQIVNEVSSHVFTLIRPRESSRQLALDSLTCLASLELAITMHRYLITSSDIAEISGLPRETVCSALTRLEAFFLYSPFSFRNTLIVENEI